MQLYLSRSFCRLTKPSESALIALVAISVSSVVPVLVSATPKVVVISLDGATPRLIDRYLASGALPADKGVGLLRSKGTYALQNVTITPSLTAASHIAIATGSTSARNDIPNNTYALVASPFLATISGFGGPIGGYLIDGPAQSSNPTAEPIWLALREAGKKVVCATFPGADGLNVTVPGLSNSPVVQPASERTVDYTIPYGEFSGVGAKGFVLSAADFGAASPSTLDQLKAAGVTFVEAREKTTDLDTFFISGPANTNRVDYRIRVVALDRTGNGFDTLVFFDATNGIKPGPFSLPSTGPAYVRAADKRSSRFYLEGSVNRSGLAFYVTNLAPDLSSVRIIRYSANDIPRNVAAPILANVDDINQHVGFWGDQPDFRITERIGATFAPFTDAELEEVYEDQVNTWTEYQGSVGLRAIDQNPNADLVMIYSEQPDGSEHQFLLIDPRQASNPADATTIGDHQDPAKVARYAGYVQHAYQKADELVQRVIDKVGVDANGRPNSNVFVVSDHGFDIFHTTVLINNLLTNAGIDPAQARAVTSGPSANIYINLRNREPNGTVSAADYLALQKKIESALRNFQDVNPNFTGGGGAVPVFELVYSRPITASQSDPRLGRKVSPFVGQDFGDIFAVLRTGYNFDGAQTPLVNRLGDPAAATPDFTVSSFYGAHGFNSNLPNMSASFFVAGPDVRLRREPLPRVRNIDVAPSIARILGVTPSYLVQGRALSLGRAPLQLEKAFSRKEHGRAGTFDLPISLQGNLTIESRRPDIFLGHQLVFKFSNPLTAGTVRVENKSGFAFTELRGDELIAYLLQVKDGETIDLTLANVSDDQSSLAPIKVRIGFLFGNADGTGLVTQSDVDAVNSDIANGGALNSETFRRDVLLLGKVDQLDALFAGFAIGDRLRP